MKKQMKHSIFARGLVIVLSAALTFQLPYNTAYSAEEYEQSGQGVQPEEGRDDFSQPTGLCAHHQKHTAECGYTESIPGSECTHEHTEECYEQEPVCGLEEHQHTEECYEEQPTACTHVHDENCGYAEETIGTECGYVCYICKIQALIDALPDPETITEENFEEVYRALADIDDKAAQYLTEDTYAQVDFSRFEACQAAVEELMELSQKPATQAAVQKLSGIQQIEINPNSLNANTIWGLTESFNISSIHLDSWGAFYAKSSSRNSGNGGLPANGYLTTPDGVEYHLATGRDLSKAYDGTDSIRLEYGYTSQKLELDTVGAYQNIYVLATAAGPGTGHYAIFEVRLDYTDGNSDSRTYHLYDWYDGSATNQSGVTLYDNIYRIGRTGSYESEVKSGYGTAPFLFSASIAANPNKLLKSITFRLTGTDTSPSSASGIYCGIYAITGRVSENAPVTPVITAGASYIHGFDVQWQEVNGATTYYMDIAKDSNFQSMLSGYNNQELNLSGLTTENVVAVTTDGTAHIYATEEAVREAVQSGTLTGIRYLVKRDAGGKITCMVEDEDNIEQAKCYYVRLRAANSYGQSLSSNTEQVHTTGLPRWAYDAGFTDETASYDPVTGVLTVKEDITLTDTIRLPDDTDITIDLNSKTITAPAGEPAIKAEDNADVNLTIKDSHPEAPGKIVANNGQDNASGDAQSGQPAIDFGEAGNGSTIKVSDGTTIQGGNGGNATGTSGAGGNGGNGILGGDNTQITVDKNANVVGGNGGNGSESGNGGNGGDGASGSSVIVDGNASTIGGDGGNAGNHASAGNGGNGATGKGGEVTVKDGANATGGNGGNAGDSGIGGSGGAGASSTGGHVSVDQGNATGGNGGNAEGAGTGGTGGNGASGSNVENNGTTVGGNGGNTGSGGTEGTGGSGAVQPSGTPSGSGSSENGKEGVGSDLPGWILSAGLRDEDVDYDPAANTIKLKQNVELDAPLTIPENEKTTIDLNGFSMKAPQGKPAVSAKGENPQLEVTDTSGNGGSIIGSDGTDGSAAGGNGANGTPAIDFSGSTGGDITIGGNAAVKGGNGGAGTGENGNGGNGAPAIAGGAGTNVNIAGGASAAGGNGGNAPFGGNGGKAGEGVQTTGTTTGTCKNGEDGNNTDPLPEWVKAAGLDEKEVSYDKDNNRLIFKKDVNLDDTLDIPGGQTTNIDLNGHDVTAPAGKPAIKAAGDGTDLNITDSSVNGGGSITGGNGTNGSGGGNATNGAPAIDFSESTNSNIHLEGNVTVKGGNGGNTSGGGNTGAGSSAIAAGEDTGISLENGAGTQDGEPGQSGGSTTPGASAADVTAIPTPTPVPADQKNEAVDHPAAGEMNTGNAIPVDTILQDKTAVVKDISLEQILQEQQKAEAAGEKADHILIDLSQETEDISKVSLPAETLKELLNQTALGTLDMVGLTVVLPDMKVVFSPEALSAVIDQATGDTLELVVDIEVRDIYDYEDMLAGRISWLNDTQIAAISDMQVEHGFEIYWTSNGIRIGDFRGGIAKLYVPYEIPQDHPADQYTIYYVSAEGDLQAFDTGYEENSLVFCAEHFSDFVIVYEGTEGSQATGASDYDHEPKTGDEAMPVATLTMIAGFLYLVWMFREHKIGVTPEQKDRLIRAIISRAKGRSYPVRLLALGMIFVLLVFYHSIGKRVEADIEELSF